MDGGGRAGQRRRCLASDLFFLSSLRWRRSYIELYLLVISVKVGTHTDATLTLLSEMFKQTRRMATLKLLSIAIAIHGFLAGVRIFCLDSILTIPHAI